MSGRSLPGCSRLSAATFPASATWQGFRMADADPQIIDAPATVIEPGEPGTEVEAPAQRRWGRLLLMLGVPLAIVIGGVVYWLGLQGKVSTDDAYVKQD